MHRDDTKDIRPGKAVEVKLFGKVVAESSTKGLWRVDLGGVLVYAWEYEMYETEVMENKNEDR